MNKQPDNTQELDEIAQLLGAYLSEIDVDGSMPVDLTRQNLQAILKWHNKQVKNAVATAEDNLDQYWNRELDKQIEAALDRLMDALSDPDAHMVMVYDVENAIEAERKRLKEAK